MDHILLRRENDGGLPPRKEIQAAKFVGMIAAHARINGTSTDTDGSGQVARNISAQAPTLSSVGT
jgi:hypothetical protein